MRIWSLQVAARKPWIGLDDIDKCGSVFTEHRAPLHIRQQLGRELNVLSLSWGQTSREVTEFPEQLWISLPAPGYIGRQFERCSDKSRLCSQIDGEPGRFSGHARESQNPVDLAKLEADIPLP